ncbi:MAG: ABC transporter ATP-binding protein [Arcobacteraceae bacterium]|nr:ABC transporter ATP-binding protein [Arcobacteraceae bacterium]MDY0327928.1 ABC transporter ATP-binding protein [Arcobacteraceae bacterium]
MIKINDLGFYYKTDEWLFRDITFDIQQGDIVTILGPNGRGKTTFLKCLTGINKAKLGDVLLEGKAGFVPQLSTPPFGFSVLDIVLMGTSQSHSIFETISDENIDNARYWLKRVGMVHLEDKDFADLSGGQKQMVLIARALCYGRDVLILDEPSSALDLANQKKLLDLLNDISSDGTTIIMTTHFPNHALRVAHKTLMLFGDREFVFGDTKEVVNEDNLSKLFETKIKCVDYNLNGVFGSFAIPL